VESPTQATRISQLEGQRLGPYQIVELIGRGGMAFVYKALQPTLRRYVAIKVLPPYFAHEENFRARFQQEAETVARLEHPNILPIYDYGQQGDVPYIVMPLITGGTLRDWLARGVSLPRALTVLSRILQALDYAHAQGVIHRDIKPSNVLMSQGDWPLLSDFGIAKLAEPALRMTKSGTMVGTPEYMAPEQSQAVAVDHRADIYAMGVVLFEVLTGRLPFQGPTPVAVILQHIKDPPPPPTSLRPDLSPIWDDICARALAKDPRDRFPTAGAMDEAIQAALRRLEREGEQWAVDVARADPRALLASAVRARGEGDWQRVISLCGQLLELDPVNGDALHLLTEAHEALRRQREQRHIEQAQDLVRQAEAALAAERFTEAQQLFDQARALGVPGAAEGLARVQQAREAARLYAAAREAVAHERWDEAAGLLDQLARQAPHYRDVAALRAQVAQAQQAAQLAATYAQGIAALQAGDWSRAITLLRQVTQVAPGYRDAATRLAEAEQVQRVAPQLANARATLAAGRPREAAALLETVVRQAPLVAEARTLLAEAQARVQEGAQTHSLGGRTPTNRMGPTSGDATRASSDRIASTQQWATRTLAETPPLGDTVVPVPSPARRPWPWLVAAVAAGALLLAAVVGGPRVIEALGGRSEPTAVPTAAAPTATPEPTAADLFPACQSAVAAAAWAEAVKACEQVRDKDPTFAGLADALATAYVNVGKLQVDQPDGLPEAITWFDKALGVKPDDPEALKQRQLAVAFQEGDSALAAGDSARAIDRFQQVFAADEKYRDAVGDGGVRNRLYQALLGAGQAALAAGQYPAAQQQCERALELVDDSADAQACRSAAIAAQQPPTPVPVPPTPRPVVQPTTPPRPAVQPTQPPRPQPTPQPPPRPAVQPTQPPRPTPAPPPPPTRAPVQVPPTRPPY